MHDDGFKKMIVLASSKYEPDKSFIEKLLYSLLTALGALRRKNSSSKDEPP